MKWLATVNYDFMPCRTIASHRCAAVSGFEVGGTLGEQAEGFMAEYVRVMEWKNQGVGDVAFWSLSYYNNYRVIQRSNKCFSVV